MKHTFVKVTDHSSGIVYDGWFLLFTAESPDISNENFHKRLIEGEFKKLMESKTERDAINLQERIKLISMNPPDYRDKVIRYGKPLLIRQIGSYMTQNDSIVVTDICKSESWPTDNDGAEIVVCENDLNAEEPWIDYLTDQFPGYRINVLNTFRDRTEQDIVSHFERSIYITFYTTFTKMDWFDKLLKATENLTGKTVIGYAVSKDSWEEVFSVFGDRIQKFVDNGNEFEIATI